MCVWTLDPGSQKSQTHRKALEITAYCVHFLPFEKYFVFQHPGAGGHPPFGMGLLFSHPPQVHRKPPQNVPNRTHPRGAPSPDDVKRRKPPRPLQCLRKSAVPRVAFHRHGPPRLAISIITTKRGRPGKKSAHPGFATAFQIVARESNGTLMRSF